MFQTIDQASRIARNLFERGSRRCALRRGEGGVDGVVCTGMQSVTPRKHYTPSLKPIPAPSEQTSECTAHPPSGEAFPLEPRFRTTIRPTYCRLRTRPQNSTARAARIERVISALENLRGFHLKNNSLLINLVRLLVQRPRRNARYELSLGNLEI